VDRQVLRLIKLWLKAPVEEVDEDGNRRMTGGKGNTRGTSQGGVASPMLANIYMNRFLKYWRPTGRREAFRAHVVSYADDSVILSRGCAAEALAWTKAVMTRLNGVFANRLQATAPILDSAKRARLRASTCFPVCTR
jgi:RNA-directed DNA polymerase